jgi:hypothetical protein
MTTMANSIYSLTAKHVHELDLASAIEMFRKLLLAETWRLHIPQRHVHISAATNVKDGGIDASVEESPSGVGGNIFFQGLTRYQIKTGTTFKPWQPSQLKKELFGSSTAAVSRTNLAKGVRACLNANGSYILICFGLDLVDDQRDAAKKALLAFLKTCRYSKPTIDIWGAGELRNFFEAYPALSLTISKREERFLSHTMWATSQEEMKRPFQKSHARDLSLEEISSSLRKHEGTHIRVCGEPGVGKTRMVLESTRVQDLSVLVVYWGSAEGFLASQQFHDIQSGHADFVAILIVDECDYDSSCRIWNSLKHRSATVRLITIHHELDDSHASSEIVYPSIAPLELEDISAILRNYGVPQEVARHYGELCSGSPRVAHIVGENLKENSPKLTSTRPTMGDVWSRYISGRHDRESEVFRRRKTVLSFISLFTKFGYSAPIAEEADAIFHLVSEADPSIGRAVFNDVVRDFRRRRILQGERTLYISPKLFHIWLWCEWWETHGHGLDVVAFTQRLSPMLFHWFGQMFRYAQDSRAAVAQVDKLLGPDGPFSSQVFIRTQVGSHFFLSLAEASPREALNCLERSIGTWDLDSLRDFSTGRREVLFALEKIVFYPDLFLRAAALVLALAETENETWANNATGIFRRLFSLASGAVAPTGATPADRFPILVEAIESHSKIRRRIALGACNEALNSNQGAMAFYSISYGLQQRVEPWRPQSREEVVNAIVSVWQLLETSAINLPDEDEREMAQTILIQRGVSLLGITALSDMAFRTLEPLASSNARITKVLTKAVLDGLRYQEHRLPKLSKDRLIELRERLSGGDFASTLRRYTGIVDWDVSLDADKGSSTAEKLRELALQAVRSPEILVRELPWATSTEAENAFPFGVELARVDANWTFLPALLESYGTAHEKLFVGLLAGYLKHIHEKDVPLWEDTLDLMASNSSLAPLVPEVTWRTGTTERAGVRIIDLAKRGVVGPEQLRLWSFGGEIRRLSESLLRRWIDFLLIHEAPIARPIGLDLFHRYYCADGAPSPAPFELAKTLLLHRDFFESRHRGGMDDFYWTETAKVIVKQVPQFGIEILKRVLEGWTSYDVSFGLTPNRAASFLYEIVREHPTKSWDLVAKLVKDLKGTRTWLIMRWLQGHADIFEEQQFSGWGLLVFADVKKWIDRSRTKRARFLARYVPRTLIGAIGKLTLEFLVRYGDDEEVRLELMANFGSEGFSGNASVHYQMTKDRMLALRKQESQTNVRRFLDEYIERLGRQVEDWRTREEREID